MRWAVKSRTTQPPFPLSGVSSTASRERRQYWSAYELSGEVTGKASALGRCLGKEGIKDWGSRGQKKKDLVPLVQDIKHLEKRQLKMLLGPWVRRLRRRGGETKGRVAERKR